jgi:hypothetical protein
MTYTEIKDLIADTLNRQDLTSTIPTFIKLCEASLNRELEHYKMEKRSSTTFNDRYHTLPTDFIKASRVHLSTGEALRLISIDEMQDMRLMSDASGKPKYYAVVAGEFELYPTPDGDHQAEVYYMASLTPLETESNFVSNEHPDLYLYGSLIHTAPYLKEDERIQTWVSLYNKALSMANSQSVQGKYSGTGLKMKIRAK